MVIIWILVIGVLFYFMMRDGNHYVLIFYVGCLIFLAGILWFRGTLEDPQYDRCHSIKTVQGIIYEFKNSQKYCSNERDVYTVIKNDSLEVPNRHDICERCKEPWHKHHYRRSDFERELDAKAYEGLIIPVD